VQAEPAAGPGFAEGAVKARNASRDTFKAGLPEPFRADIGARDAGPAAGC
jgi:hypothetical protein